MDVVNSIEEKKRTLWPTIFMDICETIRKRSLCLKYQTSALIISGTQIKAVGYNGTAPKRKECCEYWKDYYDSSDEIKNEYPYYDDWLKSEQFRNLHSKWSTLHESHAEMNALAWVSKADVTDEYVLYTYYSPCEQCAKNILFYGIKKVYYRIEYKGRSHSGLSGLEYLREGNVECIQI